MEQTTSIRHLGLIMDGNRRWAKKNSKATIEGHKAGYRKLKELLKVGKSFGIEYLSVYAFSTENWNRSKDEVEGLMNLVRWAMKNEIKELIEEELKIIFVGSKDNIPKDILESMNKIEEKTQRFDKGTLAICFNYGGQQEIVDAVNRAISKGQEITTSTISSNLYHHEVPPIDLMVRTSGEQRISNFMLWRLSYSELYFTNTLWPELSSEELTGIINEYDRRSRRYGK